MSEKRPARLTTLLCGLLLATPALAASKNSLQKYLEAPSSATQQCSGLARPGSEEAARLLAFYRQRQFHPVWDTAKQAELHTQLQQLADDGLPANHYPLPDGNASQDCSELLQSQSLLRALHDLSSGLLPASQAGLWRAAGLSTPADITLQLASRLQTESLEAVFTAARPQSSQYQGLRQQYARLRQQSFQPWPLVEPGRLVKPGESDPRLPQLTNRLKAEGYLPAAHTSEDVTLLDEPLTAALQHFQRRHGVQDDGKLGPATLTELNISAAQRLQQLKINLERWRWLSRELEPDLLLIDITGAEASLYRAGQISWHTRVQVGRPERPTPLLKSRISRLTLNPTWTVPPTIFTEDKLPEIRKNPAYLQEARLRVLDHQGNELDPASIDWENPHGILLRQDAGNRNALGQVVFRFSNPFAVYLHDTPNQRLFDKLPRVFSSGCVRVENATRLRDQLLVDLSPEQRSNIEQLQASGATHEVALPGRQLPLLIGYWTAAADSEGPLFRPDLYQLDASLREAFQQASQ